MDVCGCSPVQVVREPSVLIREPLRQFGRLRAELEQEPSYHPVRERLTGLLSLMEADVDFAKRGEVASAAERYSNTLTSLLALETDLENLRPRITRPPNTLGEADFDDSDDRNLFLDYLAQRLKSANAAARVASACFNRARDQVTGHVTIPGRVASLMESGRGAVLESGDRLEFAPGLSGLDVVPGAELTLRVVRFADGNPEKGS